VQKTNPTQESSSLGRKWFYSVTFYIEDWIVWLYRSLSKGDVYTCVGNGCDVWRVLDMNVNHRAVQADYLFFQTTHKTDLRAHRHIDTHRHPHIHTLIHTHAHSPTQTHTHACASAQTPLLMNVHLSIVLAEKKCDATWEQKMHICMYTYTHTHTHTHIYTHTGQETNFVPWCRDTKKHSTLD